MSLLGFWGVGNGQVPEACVASAAPIIFDDTDDGLPAYAPWGMYPPTNGTIYFDIPPKAAAGDSWVVGFWGRYTQGITTAHCWALQIDGENDWLKLRCNGATDTVSVGVSSSRIGTHTIDLGSFTGVDLSAWNFYEVEWLPDDTNGIVRVRVNGATPTGWTDQVNVDTTLTGSSNLGLNFWQSNGATWFGITSGVYALDTSGASNNDFLGICRFPYLAPDGDSESDFLGSDGNSVDNYQLLDEAPAAQSDTTDYVESGTVTDRQVCTIESFTAATALSGGAIVAAQAVAYATDSGAGGQAVDVGVRSNGTDDVTAKTLTTDDENRSHLAIVDPDTGVAWTEAGLNAVEVLVEVA